MSGVRFPYSLLIVTFLIKNTYKSCNQNIKQMKKDWKHPELKENEIFLLNVRDKEDWESKLSKDYKSVRRGNVAYTTGGKKIVPDMKPLFAVLKPVRMRKLVVEYKKDFKPSKDVIKVGGAVIMFTPAISEDYWIMRIKLYRNQALVAFPKFGLIGVGFANESDWNTNLPYQVSAEKLYQHIERNKKYEALTKERCIQAIKMLQFACANYEKEQKEKTIKLNMREVDNALMGAICTSGIRRIRRTQYSKR
jgi:hypothetical protein